MRTETRRAPPSPNTTNLLISANVRYSHHYYYSFLSVRSWGGLRGGPTEINLDRTRPRAYAPHRKAPLRMEKEIVMTDIMFERAELRDGLDPDSVKILAESITQDGLLQAIVVCKRDDGGYKLIAGRRRLAACMYLGWIKISARIIKEVEVAEIPALAENLMRLQMNPLEEAQACRLLHEERGLSIGDIATRTHHGTSWVQDRLALLSLPENFRVAVAKRKLSISSGMMLQEITDGELRDYYLHLATVNGATINQVSAWVQEWTSRQTLTGADTYGKPIPHGPRRAQPQQQECGFCDKPIDPEGTQWIPSCQGCYDEMLAAKFKTETPSEQPKEG